MNQSGRTFLGPQNAIALLVAAVGPGQAVVAAKQQHDLAEIAQWLAAKRPSFQRRTMSPPAVPVLPAKAVRPVDGKALAAMHLAWDLSAFRWVALHFHITKSNDTTPCVKGGKW
jgi:hypothetical protein